MCHLVYYFICCLNYITDCILIWSKVNIERVTIQFYKKDFSAQDINILYDILPLQRSAL